MASDENVAAADNGSPGEGKNEALSDFSMIVMISDTTTRTEICKL